MAIYQRDRDFQQIISDIQIDVVPLKFVKDITCVLTDGRNIVLDEHDLAEANDSDGDLEQLIKKLEFYDDLSDLKIRIDYARVENRVILDVERLLSNKT